MIRKIILSLAIVSYFSFNPLLAQNFGISATGASPNVSAGLDVNFTNKGGTDSPCGTEFLNRWGYDPHPGNKFISV